MTKAPGAPGAFVANLLELTTNCTPVTKTPGNRHGSARFTDFLYLYAQMV